MLGPWPAISRSLPRASKPTRLYGEAIPLTGIWEAPITCRPEWKLLLLPRSGPRETQLGGNYNWEGPDNYPYAGISLYNSTASEELATLVDQMLDDGDLDQGVFRKTPNGRYTYIIEE